MIIERIEQDARTLIEVAYQLEQGGTKEKTKKIISFAKSLISDIIEQCRT